MSDQNIRPGSALGFHNNRPHLMQSSRSADSLLSPDVINEDQGMYFGNTDYGVSNLGIQN